MSINTQSRAGLWRSLYETGMDSLQTTSLALDSILNEAPRFREEPYNVTNLRSHLDSFHIEPYVPFVGRATRPSYVPMPVAPEQQGNPDMPPAAHGYAPHSSSSSRSGGGASDKEAMRAAIEEKVRREFEEHERIKRWSEQQQRDQQGQARPGPGAERHYVPSQEHSHIVRSEDEYHRNQRRNLEGSQSVEPTHEHLAPHYHDPPAPARQAPPPAPAPEYPYQQTASLGDALKALDPSGRGLTRRERVEKVLLQVPGVMQHEVKRLVDFAEQGDSYVDLSTMHRTLMNDARFMSKLQAFESSGGGLRV